MPNIRLNNSILLPPDMVWEDEYSWQPTTGQEDVSLAGTTIVQVSRRNGPAGRRITLASGDNFAWVKRGVLDALLLYRDARYNVTSPLEFPDGRVFQVIPAPSNFIEGYSSQPGRATNPDTRYKVKLAFMQLA